MPMLIVFPTPKNIDKDFNLSQADIEELTIFVINEMGAEITGSISSSWDINSNRLEASIGSGSFRGDDAVDIEMIIYMNDTGDLVSLYAEAMLVPGNVKITANIVPADVNTAKKQIIKKAYYAVDALNRITDSDTSNEVASFMLYALGYEQIVSLSSEWDRETLELMVSFSDALLDGGVVTDAQMTISVDMDGNISAFNSDRTESGTVINQGLGSLDVADKFIYKVANYAAHDLYDYEQALNHTSLLTNSIRFNLYQGGVDINQDLIIDNGELLSIERSSRFDAIRVEADSAYQQDINITDAIDVLRHIVNLEKLDTGGTKYHAADVNNDDNINITDAINILRHIVNLETIDHFDLIDEQGNRVTQLDASHASSDTLEWAIVANGDVNLSGGFADDYIIQSELL